MPYRYEIPLHLNHDDEDSFCEMMNFINYDSECRYYADNRCDGDHIYYYVEFSDPAESLMFKLRWNVTFLEKTPGPDIEHMTIEKIKTRGYQEYKLEIHHKKALDFQAWCDELAIATVDEIKFIKNSTGMEPWTIWAPSKEHYLMAKLAWGGA